MGVKWRASESVSTAPQLLKGPNANLEVKHLKVHVISRNPLHARVIGMISKEERKKKQKNRKSRLTRDKLNEEYSWRWYTLIRTPLCTPICTLINESPRPLADSHPYLYGTRLASLLSECWTYVNSRVYCSSSRDPAGGSAVKHNKIKTSK